MSLKIYWKYLKYVLEHKKNVFIECWHKGLYIHAVTHDLSKFMPSEFFPYAKYDFQNPKNNTEKAKEDFKKAWQHHKDKNKHHWNYWSERNLKMPAKYIKQMICDWKAMSRKFGGTAQEYYLKNYNNIILEKTSRLTLELLLDLNFKRCCECDDVFWMTVQEIIEDCINYKENYPHKYCDEYTKEWINEINQKYNLDLLKLLGYKEEQIYN